MKQVKFNEGELTEEEIDKVVKKARALVLNTRTREALLVQYSGVYMLPGGKIDNNETEIEALKRELLEEAGIEISEKEATPYLVINSYDKDYLDRREGKLNRLTQTTFFEISTDKDIDKTKTKLSESEKEKGLTIEYKPLSIMRYLIETNTSDNPKRKQFDRETLTAINEYTKMKQRDNDNMER